MNEERRQILEMLASGKIKVDEAERLLAAVGQPRADRPSEPPAEESKIHPRMLYIRVAPKEGNGHGKNVDIKIPVMLIKAGMKLGSLLPEGTKEKISSHFRDKGIDLDLSRIDDQTLDQLVQALTKTSIDIDDDRETIRIYCN